MCKGGRKDFFDGAFIKVVVRGRHVFDLEQDGEAGRGGVVVCRVKRGVATVFVVRVVIQGGDGFVSFKVVSFKVGFGVVGSGCGGRVRG